jgi:hypothetical protein
MVDERAAENLWEVPQGRPEHHDEPEGDGKPVSFIEELRRAPGQPASTPTR